MLIGLSIAILCFLARKITADGRGGTQELYHPPRPSATPACNKKLHHRLPNRLPPPFGVILPQNAWVATHTRVKPAEQRGKSESPV